MQNNPYSPSQADFQSNFANNADGQYELAGRGVRLGAVLLNSLLAVVCMIPLFVGMIGGAATGIGASAANQGEAALFGMLAGAGIGLAISGVALLALLIIQLMTMAKHSQSLGKRWLGIKVVRADGSPISAGRYIGLREILPGVINNIPVVGPIFSLVNPLLIFRENRHCLHDDIADSVVVRVQK